ncbi:MAG: rod shape-determining protein MreC [Planctomycetota bacterium]
MASALLTSSRVLVAVASALAVNSQLPTRWGSMLGHVLKPTVDFAVLPVRTPVYRLAVDLGGNDQPTGRDDPPATPEQLRDRYDAALVRIDQQQQRIAELVRTLELLQGVREIEQPDTTPLSAKVTATTDAGPRVVLTLNRGTRDRVAPGMTVVFKSSVVGRVIEPVGPSSADVELITAHRAGLQVRVRRGPDSIPYDNIRAQRGDDGRTFTADVARDLRIRPGADVLLADAVHYPDARGRLLGVVENIVDYEPDPHLLQRLIIRPAVDLRALREVAVLRPDPPASAAQPSDP